MNAENATDAPAIALEGAAGLSVIVPALNEEDGIGPTLAALRAALASIPGLHEIIVVDDGSADRTGDIARGAGCRVLTHPAQGGYGFSLADGVRNATYETLAICDADGSYPVEELPALVEAARRFDMVIGQRTGPQYMRRALLSPLRTAFLLLTTFVTGTWIPDPNSGLRVFHRSQVLPILTRLPRGFSFTTTLTLILTLEGRFIRYQRIPYRKRIGRSKVRLVRDALRVGQTLVEVILVHNPLKMFIVVSIVPLVALAPMVMLTNSRDGSITVAAILLASATLIFTLGMLAVTVLGRRMRR